MSAVLEALKKLEQEAQSPATHPLWPETRPDRGWRWVSLCGGLLISLVLFGLAGYGVVALTGKIAADRTSEARRQPLPASSPSEVKPEALAVRPVEPTMAPERALPETVGPPAIAPRKEDVVAVVLAVDEPPVETVTATSSPPLPVPEKTGGEGEPAPAASALGGGPEPAAGLLRDPSVKLQAISWSADANRRMAVINGKICRENETIDGYVVLAIGPEAVLVGRGAVRGRLVFNSR